MPTAKSVATPPSIGQGTSGSTMSGQSSDCEYIIEGSTVRKMVSMQSIKINFRLYFIRIIITQFREFNCITWININIISFKLIISV